MSLIKEGDFEELVPEALNVFTLPPYQSSVQSHYFIQNRPISQINDTTPLEFKVSNSGADYIDLKRTRLHLKVKVTQADGNTDLAAEENVAPVNLFMQTLFSQVSVYLQNELVSSTNNYYPYKSMMKALLGYGAEAKQTQLTTQLFYKDYAESDRDLESSDVTGSLNSGMMTRAGFIEQSKELTLCGPPLRRRLQNESSPGQRGGHDRENTSNAYPYVKSEVKVTSIPSTEQSHTIDNLSSPVASRYIVGLVESASLNSSLTGNPFNFKSSMVKKITLSIDGNSVPGQPTEADDIATYVSMLDGMGLWNEDKGNHITRSEFLLGNALFVFDLDKICSDSEYLNLVKSGDVKLHLEFKAALTSTLSCIVLSQRNSLIEIDQARNVFVK
ncbi:uncharacterized protein F54H12.2-like [Haliotis rubra]|uniref:uncharacterized protein F54H12.2-like n=1 Tax=Haliotis rubra TaxID=36100 RepID=UPI001EE58912|nr:uncharacterized protein F54H12.2-like [Haliotis rubra]